MTADPTPSAQVGWRPVPDPTELSTAAIEAAAKAMTSYVDGQVAILRQRLDGIDEATKLRLEGLQSLQSQSRDWVDNLKELHGERFDSIQTQFKERDTRSEREARDSAKAVDAAFAAQKEASSETNKSNTLAISKSETATAETIAKLNELFTTTINGMGDKIDDVKERVGRIESRQVGAGEAKQEHVADRTGLYATVGIVISVIFVSIAILGFIVAEASRAS